MSETTADFIQEVKLWSDSLVAADSPYACIALDYLEVMSNEQSQ